MSEAKHTPGPWSVYVPNSLSNDDMAYGIDTDHGIESVSVVLFYGGILKKEDARLIAAAPDLLDALQTIIEVISNTEYGEIDRTLAVKDARAAIAKATKVQM